MGEIVRFRRVSTQMRSHQLRPGDVIAVRMKARATAAVRAEVIASGPRGVLLRSRLWPTPHLVTHLGLERHGWVYIRRTLLGLMKDLWARGGRGLRS